MGFLGLLLGSSGAGFLLFLLGGAVAVNIGLLHTVKAAGAAGVIGGKLLCTAAGSFEWTISACFCTMRPSTRITAPSKICRLLRK